VSDTLEDEAQPLRIKIETKQLATTKKREGNRGIKFIKSTNGAFSRIDLTSTEHNSMMDKKPQLIDVSYHLVDIIYFSVIHRLFVVELLQEL
jgi:hypothetical protein